MEDYHILHGGFLMFSYALVGETEQNMQIN